MKGHQSAARRKSRSVSGQSSSPTKPSAQSSVRANSFLSKRVLLACLVLIAASVAVYAPVRNFRFVMWDDPEYVLDNVHVAQGLTWQGARWALTSTDAAN